MASSTSRSPFPASSATTSRPVTTEKKKNRAIAATAVAVAAVAIFALSAAPRGAAAAAAAAPRSRDLDDAVQMLQMRSHLQKPHSLLPFIVNPFSPILLCDWHVAGQPDQSPGNPTWSSLALNPLNASTAGDVRPCDSVCVDATAFESFVVDVLPSVRARFVLFTHRWRLPQLNRTALTDLVRGHPRVAHWFAQNPVYLEDDRYSAFPYGIRAEMLQHFSDAFLRYHGEERQLGGSGSGSGSSNIGVGASTASAQSNTINDNSNNIDARAKSTTIEHLHLGNSHPSRQKLIERRASRGRQKESLPEYYEKIARTKFTTSPRGDRPDCYRHWESIGLGAMPISNIDQGLYGPLFGDDMVYVDGAEEMLELLDGPGSALEQRYRAPRSEKVLSRFWTRRVDERVRQCLAEEKEEEEEEARWAS